MRFIYGTIFGILATMIAGILYLAFTGGDYLLVLSPKYHELSSTVAGCRHAEEQRDALAKRLEALEVAFDGLTRKFNELPKADHGAAAPPPASDAAHAAPGAPGEPTHGPESAEHP